MTQTKHQPTKLSQRIRKLLKEGRSTAEIMALTGTHKHIVGLVKYHMERQENARISPITGKPVRKYKKNRKSLAERGAELRRMVKERKQQAKQPEPPKVQYIEIEVPQPHYNLTWGQRFKALFTGRV